MKKFLTLIFFLSLMHQGLFAQCTINSGNTTDGFTPASIPCITAGTAYGQAVQVHIPATGTFSIYTLTVDSVQLLSVTGMPAGIAVSGSPASGVIHGGGNGCLWYSGTTNAASGSYPLTFNVRIWTSYTGVSFPPTDTTLAALGYNFSLDVCGTSSACTINAGNTTNGFTPTSLPCITRNTAYGQQDQVHVPATANYQTLTLNIDSVKLLSVTGMPAGIAVSGNPASGVIRGGGNGCLWYSGTTSAASGSYPLTFRVRVWASYPGFGQNSFDTTLAGLGYNFSLDVCGSSTVTATITPAGPDSICTGQTVTLQANTGSGYTYRWSDASHTTTSSLTTGTAGSYRVTVYSGTDSAVSAYTTVSVGTPPGNQISLGGPSAICAGDSVRLTAVDSGYRYSFHWSTNQNTRSIFARSAGSYGLTVTNAWGCTASGSQSITVNAAPTETILQNGTTLTAQTAYTSYQWYWNNNLIAGATSQNYIASQNGTYTVRVTNAAGCTGISSGYVFTLPTGVTATINPAGPDSICAGQTVTLQATTGSGFIYRWSDAAHTTTSTLTTGTAGSYHVTVYDAGGDSAVSAPVTVVVIATPSGAVTLTGTSTFCQGDSLIITAASGSGLSYAWSNTTTTRAIKVTTGGSYTVTVSNSFGCTAVSSPTVVTVNPLPNETITQNGYTLTAQNAMSSYQWYRDNVLITGATSQAYTVTQNGTYTLQVTDASGCTAISNSISITTLGIGDLQNTALGIYPNPGKGIFTITAPGSIGLSYEVSDMLGRVMASGEIHSDRQDADLSALPAGSYILSIGSTNKKVLRFAVSR